MKNDNEKTQVGHWDENWRRASTKAISSENNSGESFVWQRLKTSISSALAAAGISKGKLIEIGAGGSEWMSLFHSTYGFSVDGLDYSEVGCQRTREILEASSISGNVFYADMFAAPSDLLGKYDLVVSFGLVEHFEDTSAAIQACASFARPGGLVITTIPNMAGLHGWLYRIYDRKVYEMHVPLTLDALTQAHTDAGLHVMRAEHLFGLPGVIDGARVEPHTGRRLLRSVVHKLTKWHWYLERKRLGVPENPITSPYLICIARKPE
jgi:2-polyprenyl-3-methyl-5-hydroxy-6-metoxy-1,4-benzoquinol methylase